ncbi:hypothetical protein V8E52_000797 [Russula decolorans]
MPFMALSCCSSNLDGEKGHASIAPAYGVNASETFGYAGPVFIGVDGRPQEQSNGSSGDICDPKWFTFSRKDAPVLRKTEATVAVTATLASDLRWIQIRGTFNLNVRVGKSPLFGYLSGSPVVEKQPGGSEAVLGTHEASRSRPEQLERKLIAPFAAEPEPSASEGGSISSGAVAKLKTQVEGEEVPGMFIMVNLVLGSRTTNP